MGFLISLLGRLGLGPRLAGIAGYGIVALAVAAALWGIHHSGFNAGKKASDREWQAAEVELQRQAAIAGGNASAAAVQRLEEHSQRVAEEKERIDEAQAGGDSTFDVLFPDSGVRP
jgi:hypothetical protein